MRRLRRRSDLAPVKARLLLSLLLVVGAIVMAATGRMLGAFGLLLAGFVVVAGAKRPR